MTAILSCTGGQTAALKGERKRTGGQVIVPECNLVPRDAAAHRYTTLCFRIARSRERSNECEFLASVACSLCISRKIGVLGTNRAAIVSWSVQILGYFAKFGYVLINVLFEGGLKLSK